MSHKASHNPSRRRSAAESRRAPIRRHVGVWLLRRGAIFHVRRRTPAEVRKTIPQSVLTFSLRTHLPAGATLRAARLSLAIQALERAVMTRHALNEAEKAALLRQLVQARLQDICRRADDSAPVGTVDERTRSSAARWTVSGK